MRELLAQSSVLLFVFLPHTTHLFHALDLAIFGMIKTILNNLEQSDEAEKQSKLAAKLPHAFEKDTTSANIR